MLIDAVSLSPRTDSCVGWIVMFAFVYQDRMKLFQQLISDDYRVHMQLDNLPVAIQGDRFVSCLVNSLIASLPSFVWNYFIQCA